MKFVNRTHTSIWLITTLTTGALLSSSALPLQAATQTKIFGTRMGQGGLQECQIEILQGISANDRAYKYPSYVLPHGWRDRINKSIRRTNESRKRRRRRKKKSIFKLFSKTKYASEHSTSPNPCFVRTGPGGGELYLTKNLNRPWNEKGERVLIRWPHSTPPTFPGMVRSGGRSTQISAIADRGSVEIIELYTKGLPVEGQVISGLTQKFGKPSSRHQSTMTSSGGKSAKFQIVTWKIPEMQVDFFGVIEGRRTEGNEFGAGKIYIRTQKGQAMHERNLKATQSETNL